MKSFQYILTFILITLFDFPVASQSIYDTTLWNSTKCEYGEFTMKFPKIYKQRDSCGLFFKEVDQKKIFPIHVFTEKVFQLKKFRGSKNPKTYIEWIEFRASVLYAADGVNGSTYGDSVALCLNFENKNGIKGSKLYIYVSDRYHEKGKEIVITNIRGPVYVFKKHQDLSTTEPIIYFQTGSDQSDYMDRRLIELMIDTFNFIQN